LQTSVSTEVEELKPLLRNSFSFAAQLTPYGNWSY